MKDRLLNGLNTLLVANLFLVLGSFFWWVIALIGRSTGISLGLDLWYSLWEPVFTPAIGILMGGALLSSAISWVKKRFPPKSELDS
jgi:hypothetical protein